MTVIIKKFALCQNLAIRRVGIVQESAFEFVVYSKEESVQAVLEKAILIGGSNQSKSTTKYILFFDYLKLQSK